jgi:hypothetical protein
MDPDAVPGDGGGVEKVTENRARALAVVAPADPAASAGLVVVACRLVTVVGRVAQADNDGRLALDLEGLGVLLGDRLEKERQLRRLGVRAFERVGQVNICVPSVGRAAPRSRRARLTRSSVTA